MLWRSETGERTPNKWWKKTTLNKFATTHLREQPKQRLTEVWSGAQQTVVDEVIDERRWRYLLVLDIYCSESSANIFCVKWFLSNAKVRVFWHDVNSCCGINLCWYPVLSILASYKYEHFRLFVDFPYQKNINIGQHLLKLFENFVGVWVFFEPQCRIQESLYKTDRQKKYILNVG